MVRVRDAVFGWCPFAFAGAGFDLYSAASIRSADVDQEYLVCGQSRDGVMQHCECLFQCVAGFFVVES